MAIRSPVPLSTAHPSITPRHSPVPIPATPDWLLVCRINGQELILILTRTGINKDLY